MIDEVDITIAPIIVDVEIAPITTVEVLKDRGPRGEQGPTGPTGQTGPAGPGVAPGGTTNQILTKVDNTDFNTEWKNPETTYIFQQSVPSATWDIVHNLGKFPSVSVVDSAGSIVVGSVTYVSNNELTINFSAGFSGTAYLN